VSTIQIVLLSLFISFMAVETYWWGGAIYIARPIFGGMLVGLLMGDFQTGLKAGGMIEMVFLGGMSIGAYAPPNSYIGGMVGTALAIISGDIATGVTLAYPIGLLVQWLNYVVTNINLIWVEKLEKCAQAADTKGITVWTYACIFTRMIIQYFLPTVVALLLGSTFIQNIYDKVPAVVTNGMKVAAGILPAIGMASIMNTLGIKKSWPYFIIGFVMSVYLNMPIMAIALSGLGLAAVIFEVSPNKQGAASLKMDASKENKNAKLDNHDLVRIFFRSFLSMAGFNYKSYNAPGYLYSIVPGLQKIYKDNPEKYREALVRNCEFFNSHPYMKNLVIGISLAMEEENAIDPDFDTKMISSTKTALMGPLAGIGDSVFQGIFRVLFSAIGASMSIEGNPAGPWVYLIPNILLSWGTRWYFLKGGYKYGTELVKKLRSSNLFERFVQGATIVGMMVIAAMTASYVSLTLKPSWVYVAATADAAAKAVTLQGLFDAILPKFLPVALVFIMYKVMKKVKGGIYWCLGGTFVIAFIGVAIGLF